MKQTILISLLFLLSILSYSCGKDKDKDDINNTDINPAEFMFKGNKYYLYDVSVNYPSEEFKNLNYSMMIKTLDYSEKLEKNAFRYQIISSEYRKRESYFFYVEGNKLYGLSNLMSIHNTYENKMFPENISEDMMEWLLCFDFNQSEWNYEFSFDDIQTNIPLNIRNDYKTKIKGKNYGAMTYEFQGTSHIGHQFEISQDIKVTEKDPMYGPSVSEYKVTKEVYFIKSIGIVEEKYNVVRKYTHWNEEVTNENIIVTVKLTGIEDDDE